MGGTYQIFHPTFFSRVGLEVLILYVFLYVCHAAPRSGSPEKKASEKIKLSANIAARVDLIGGREQAHRGGHESTFTQERKCRDHVDHVVQLCEFLSFSFR